MRNNSYIAAFALLALFLPAVAQQHPVPTAPHPAPTTHVRPATPTSQARLSDAQIDAAIRMKLAKSKIAADKFRFKVQGGVVTIEGNTDVIQHKGAATRMAKTAGAIAVNNHIQISEAARERATANLEKGRRRAQLTRSEPRSDTSTPRMATSAPRSSAAAIVVRKNGIPPVQNR